MIYLYGMKKYVHEEDCKCGAMELPLTEESSWYVNSPEHHNCFWTYLRYNERPHTLNEIAQLLDLSISAITAIEKRAFTKLRKKVKPHELEKKS